MTTEEITTTTPDTPATEQEIIGFLEDLGFVFIDESIAINPNFTGRSERKLETVAFVD